MIGIARMTAARARASRFITQIRYRVFRIVSGVILLVFAGKLARELR